MCGDDLDRTVLGTRRMGLWADRCPGGQEKGERDMRSGEAPLSHWYAAAMVISDDPKGRLGKSAEQAVFTSHLLPRCLV
jgi:hypothetical protein